MTNRSIRAIVVIVVALAFLTVVTPAWSQMVLWQEIFETNPFTRTDGTQWTQQGNVDWFASSAGGCGGGRIERAGGNTGDRWVQRQHDFPAITGWDKLQFRFTHKIATSGGSIEARIRRKDNNWVTVGTATWSGADAWITNTFDISTNRAYEVKNVYLILKGSGHRRVDCVQILGIDSTPPDAGAASSPTYSTSSTITVSYTGAGDLGGSGFQANYLWYKKEAGGAWQYTGLHSASTPNGSVNFTAGAGQGTYFFKWNAGDNYVPQNTSWSNEVSTVFDSVAPTGSISINSGAAYTTSRTVTLSLSASDATSGVSQMQFLNDGGSWGSWETYATSKAWNLRDLDGLRTVSVRYSDNAGNVSTAYNDTITLDRVAPTVTINQAASQDDPTSDSPINFTAVFSEDVTGFADGDVTLGGTAGATTAVVTGGPQQYNIAVSGMTQNGTVTASIAAGVATDLAGNPNEASTSTDNEVTYTGMCTEPSITLQPTGQTVCEGATATFSVTALGTEPLSYQWQKNEVDIGGANSSSYETPTLVLGDDGNQYRCVVSNACGSVTSNSATLTVNALPIGEAKKRADGESVILSNKLVIAVFSDHFYVEEADRSSGIRAVIEPMSGELAVGKSVNLQGTLATTSDGERVVEATSVEVSDGQAPDPLVGLINRDLGGTDFHYDPGTGAGQMGVEDGVGPNNIGLLVKTTGTVTAVGEDFFYIDDGLNARDFSIFKGIRVRSESLTKPASGEYVAITGISSIMKVQDRVFRSIRPRTDNDIQIIADP